MTRALVIDSNIKRAQTTEFYLQQEGYKVAVTRPGTMAMTQCKALPPDIVLLMVDNWQDQTLNTLIELKSAKQTKSIPVIVLAACADPQTLIYSLDLGAHECVLEPADPRVLAARIRSVRAIATRQQQLEKANNELSKLASTDALTHVFNRRHFMTLGQGEFLRAKRYGRDLAVIMLDIDEFKTVNDRYGHAAGDMALVNLAECCRTSVRDSDIVGRLGGEEFAICCPEADLEGAEVIAERIRQVCESTRLEFDGHRFSVTVSLGVTMLQGDDSRLEQLMLRADKLLYRAKEQGRNCAIAC